MADLKFVNTLHNNGMYEWGRNCATLEYDKDKSASCVAEFGHFTAEDMDQFWEGYHEGPRLTGEVISISVMGD